MAPAPTAESRNFAAGRGGCEAPDCGILLTVKGGGRKRPALRQKIFTYCEFAEIRAIISMYRRDVEDAVPYDGEVGAVRVCRGLAVSSDGCCAARCGQRALREWYVI